MLNHKKFNKGASRLAMIIGAGLVGLSGFTSAQAESSSTDEDANVSFDEIIVTASKREQSILEVPVSIQALGEELLTNSNIRDTQQILEFVPGSSEGLSVSVGQRRFQIRGIEQGGAGPTIGYYIGETAYPTFESYAPVGRSYDMNRVEVLRGPQGTLYGNGSMGGVIRFIPNAPNLSEFEGGVRAAYTSIEGGDSGYYLDGFLNIPVVEDKLAIRVVGSFEEVGGYLEDAFGNEDVNDADVGSYRITALFQPTEALGIEFMYFRNEVDQNAGTLISIADPDNPVYSGLPEDLREVAFDIFAVTLSYDFADFSITSNTSYVETDSASTIALNTAFSTVTASTSSGQEFWSNETRLVSTSDSPLQWLAGIFYTTADTFSDLAIEWNPEIPPFLVNSRTITEDERESISLFGEVSYELLDGKLIPLFGIRYFEESFDGDSPAIGGEPDGVKFDSTNFRFNLSYLPDEETTVYLNIAQGFRSGSFNDQNICALHQSGGLPCELILDSDTLTSYELGSKLQLADGSLLLDLAIYYQDWSDARFQTAFGTLFATYGVGDVESYGVDIGVQYSPASIQGLSFTATGNWNSTEFTNVADLGDVSAEDGQQINFVPKWSMSLIANYFWPISDNVNGLINVSYSHISGQRGTFNTNAPEGDSRNLVRARVGAEFDMVSVYLFANNIFDEDGEIYRQLPTDGALLTSRDRPRTYGAEVEFKF